MYNYAEVNEMRISYFLDDKYNVLQYLKENEQIYKGQRVVKKSQTLISTELKISRNKVIEIMHELLSVGAIEKLGDKGKYRLTNEANILLEDTWSIDAKEVASKYNCASFFAGVGGIDLGFEKVGFKTVYANEIDTNATKTYELNFDIKVDNRDINQVTKDIENGIDFCPDKKIDILLGGFPCQAFSIAGYREGFEDKKGRGGLFFELMKVIREKKPEILFLENVKNLKNHDDGKTYKIIKEALESEGYHVREQVLNSMEFGNLPQNRERIYIIAFKDVKKAEKFKFPGAIALTNKLNKVVDYDAKYDSRFYYTEDSFAHYEILKKSMIRMDTVYQWRRVYVRENKNNVCPTLTANMGTGGHNVPLVLTDNGIRKLLPRECFGLQGFPNNYKLPSNMAMSHLYKQAGNAVSVSVIERIANEIAKVL